MEKLNEGDIIDKFINAVSEVDNEIKECFNGWPQISNMLIKYNYCKINKYNIE